MKPMAAAVSVSGIVGCGGQSLAAWTYYNEPTDPTPLGPAELTFVDDKSVRHFKGGVCVKNFLDDSGKGWLEKGPDVNFEEWKKLEDTFTYNVNGRANGCVVISWEKETWKGGSLRAKVRYEWVFTVGDESLVTYGLFNPEELFNDITWRTAYINRKNGRIAWLVRYISKDHTPLKPNTPNSKKEYWGINPYFHYLTLCRYSLNCVDEPERKITGEVKWTWEEDKEGGKSFTEWTQNFWGAFDYLSHNEYHNLTKFRSLVNSRKGTWTQR